MRHQLKLQMVLKIQRWWRPRCVATFLDEVELLTKSSCHWMVETTSVWDELTATSVHFGRLEFVLYRIFFIVLHTIINGIPFMVAAHGRLDWFACTLFFSATLKVMIRAHCLQWSCGWRFFLSSKKHKTAIDVAAHGRLDCVGSLGPFRDTF